MYESHVWVICCCKALQPAIVSERPSDFEWQARSKHRINRIKDYVLFFSSFMLLHFFLMRTMSGPEEESQDKLLQKAADSFAWQLEARFCNSFQELERNIKIIEKYKE